MTAEEKVKAIDVVRQMVADGQVSQEVAEKYFPELKESEDEGIRKELISLFQDCIDGVNHRYTGSDSRRWLAWLEKQGEHANFRNKIQIGDKVTRNEDGVLVNLSQLKRIAKPAEEYNITGIGSKNAQGKLGEMIKNLKPVNEVLEQGSAWSEKYIADVFEKVGLAKIAREQGYDALTEALQYAMIKLSKFTPQPKQEWSKEDEDMIESIYEGLQEVSDELGWSDFGHIPIDDIIEWLNFLKPQNTWKPSESDIRILEQVIDGTVNPINYHATLHAILEKLKKLREE